MQASKSSTPFAARLSNCGKHLYPPTLDVLSEGEFSNHLEAHPVRSDKAQLYVHLPFCETLCTFCVIQKYRITDDQTISEYVRALVSELRHLAATPLVQHLRFTSVYMGGGTPTVVPDRDLAFLLETIVDVFRLDSPQITLEGHVGTLTRNKIRSAKTIGFNRLSTGVQTFDPALRSALNLTPTYDDIARCFDVARDEGMLDFNLDLLYNIPGQQLSTLENDIRQALALNPSGIDLYETVIGHKTPLHRQVMDGELGVESNPDKLAAAYLLAEDLLASAGFEQKNLYAWDRPGYENVILGHTKALRSGSEHLIGAGLSAYSIINGAPFFNERTRKRYVQRVADTGHGARWHWAGGDESISRFMIMSLQDLSLDRRVFESEFQITMEEIFARQLNAFVDRGLLERTDNAYNLTRLGRAWATTMATEFYTWPVLRRIMENATSDRLIPMTHEEAFDLPIYAVFHPATVVGSCEDFGLAFRYLRTLRAANPRWSRTFLASAARAARRSGFPPWGWYAAFVSHIALRAVRRGLARCVSAIGQKREVARRFD
jgi:oxygen-independent coproporphyrinogen-3 oxidase